MKRAVRENFDLSVREYRAYEAATGRFAALAERLREAMVARGARLGCVLDAGAGTGASTTVLGAEGTAVALDLSRGMLAANPASRRVLGDIESLPFRDDAFDAVAFTASLFLTPSPDRAAREARRVLRADGVVGATALEGWFAGGTDVLADLPRRPRSPQSPATVEDALEAEFTVDAGRWSFASSAAAVRAFHAMPAGAARFYPRLPPDVRRERALAVLDDLEGPVEERWRWVVGR